MRATQRITIFCAAYLIVIWIVAILPVVSVMLEYGPISLCDGTSLGWFIATLYGSFFIYPITIGGFAMAAVYFPLVAVLSVRRSEMTTYVFLGFYVLTTVVICALEFSAEPGALFQVPASIISARPTFLNGLAKACSGLTFPDYQREMRGLIGAETSVTGWLYFPGFVAQALMHNTLFVVFVASVYLPKRTIVQRAPYLNNSIFFVLGYALFLGSIWCLFRLSYRHDMFNLLHVENPFFGDWAVIVLYFAVLAVFVVYFQFGLEQLAKTISTVFQFLVFIGGVAYIQFDQADRFFGTKATVLNVMVLFLLFVFLSALTLAFLLRTAEQPKLR
jgi:hypothetical protein